jgi:nucleoside-diphosphate-sugar epimerase
MVPVWPVFQPWFVLPVKGNVMRTSILVTGGTGTLGRPVAQRLRDAGASETVLSRCGDRGNRQPQRRMIAD